MPWEGHVVAFIIAEKASARGEEVTRCRVLKDKVAAREREEGSHKQSQDDPAIDLPLSTKNYAGY
jgi:hypothetical protein